jgi:hypothetical protein
MNWPRCSELLPYHNQARALYARDRHGEAEIRGKAQPLFQDRDYAVRLK